MIHCNLPEPNKRTPSHPTFTQAQRALSRLFHQKFWRQKNRVVKTDIFLGDCCQTEATPKTKHWNPEQSNKRTKCFPNPLLLYLLSGNPTINFNITFLSLTWHHMGNGVSGLDRESIDALLTSSGCKYFLHTHLCKQCFCSVHHNSCMYTYSYNYTSLRGWTEETLPEVQVIRQGWKWYPHNQWVSFHTRPSSQSTTGAYIADFWYKQRRWDSVFRVYQCS